MTSPPQFSPDGAWFWTGSVWVPAPPRTNEGQHQPESKVTQALDPVHHAPSGQAGLAISPMPAGSGAWWTRRVVLLPVSLLVVVGIPLVVLLVKGNSTDTNSAAYQDGYSVAQGSMAPGDCNSGAFHVAQATSSWSSGDQANWIAGCTAGAAAGGGGTSNDTTSNNDNSTGTTDNTTYVEVPNVLGMGNSDAGQTLSGAGLGHSAQFNDCINADSQVTDQSISPGEQVPEGSVVTYDCSP